MAFRNLQPQWLSIVILLAFCLTTPSAAIQAQAGTGEAETVTMEARITSIRVPTAPVSTAPVTVEINGELGDSCSELGNVIQGLQGNTIRVAVMTVRPANAFCTAVVAPFDLSLSLDISGLAPGDYIVDVNGITAPLTISRTPEATTQPQANIAAQCPQAGDDTLLFFAENVRYCFLYPAGLTAQILEDGTASITAPAVGAAPGASLLITQEPANGRTLDEVQAGVVADALDVTLNFEETPLGSERAIVTENTPGRIMNRVAFVIWQDHLYTFTLQPIDDLFPEEAAIANTLWATMRDSFVFISDRTGGESAATAGDCVAASPGLSVFVGFGICFAYPEDYNILSSEGMVVLTEPAVEGRAVRVNLVLLAAESDTQSLGQVQNDLGATYPDAALIFEARMLGGIAALVSENIPGITANRQAFTLWNGRAYTIILSPLDDSLPQASEEAQRVWDLFTESVLFIREI